MAGYKKRAEIDERIGEDPGSQSYISHYPGTLTAVVEQLSAKERADYAALAEKWNEEGVPRDLQKRLAIS